MGKWDMGKWEMGNGNGRNKLRPSRYGHGFCDDICRTQFIASPQNINSLAFDNG